MYFLCSLITLIAPNIQGLMVTFGRTLYRAAHMQNISISPESSISQCHNFLLLQGNHLIFQLSSKAEQHSGNSFKSHGLYSDPSLYFSRCF